MAQNTEPLQVGTAVRRAATTVGLRCYMGPPFPACFNLDGTNADPLAESEHGRAGTGGHAEPEIAGVRAPRAPDRCRTIRRSWNARSRARRRVDAARLTRCEGIAVAYGRSQAESVSRLACHAWRRFHSRSTSSCRRESASSAAARNPKLNDPNATTTQGMRFIVCPFRRDVRHRSARGRSRADRVRRTRGHRGVPRG